MARKPMPTGSHVAELAAIAADDATPATEKPSRKRQKKDKSKFKRVTIDLPLEVHFRLDTHATLRKTSLAALAIRQIDRACAEYKADAGLKSVWAEISRQRSEDARESAA